MGNETPTSINEKAMSEEIDAKGITDILNKTIGYLLEQGVSIEKICEAHEINVGEGKRKIQVVHMLKNGHRYEAYFFDNKLIFLNDEEKHIPMPEGWEIEKIKNETQILLTQPHEDLVLSFDINSGRMEKYNGLYVDIHSKNGIAILYKRTSDDFHKYGLCLYKDGKILPIKADWADITDKVIDILPLDEDPRVQLKVDMKRNTSSWFFYDPGSNELIRHENYYVCYNGKHSDTYSDGSSQADVYYENIYDVVLYNKHFLPVCNGLLQKQEQGKKISIFKADGKNILVGRVLIQEKYVHYKGEWVSYDPGTFELRKYYNKYACICDCDDRLNKVLLYDENNGKLEPAGYYLQEDGKKELVSFQEDGKDISTEIQDVDIELKIVKYKGKWVSYDPDTLGLRKYNGKYARFYEDGSIPNEAHLYNKNNGELEFTGYCLRFGEEKGFMLFKEDGEDISTKIQQIRIRTNKVGYKDRWVSYDPDTLELRKYNGKYVGINGKYVGINNGDNVLDKARLYNKNNEKLESAGYCLRFGEEKGFMPFKKDGKDISTEIQDVDIELKIVKYKGEWVSYDPEKGSLQEVSQGEQ